MTYDQLLARYRQQGGQVGTDAQNKAFNDWTAQLMQRMGVSSWDALPANTFDVANSASGGGLQPVSSGFNAAAYFQSNPEIASFFDGLAKDDQGRAILPTGDHLTRDQFAEYHYNTYGRNEGRQASFNTPGQAAPATGFVPTYLQQHPELVDTYLNSPQLQQQFGSLAKYTLAYVNANGTMADKSAAQGADTNLSDASLFPTLGYEQQGGGGDVTQPLEQQLLDRILPGLENQIGGDAGRQANVTQLLDQTHRDYGDLRNVLGGSDVQFDGQTYFRENPDVAQAFAALPAGPTPNTRLVNGQPMTADQFAAQHYQTYGENEGRRPAYTSQVLTGQRANADRTAATIVGNNSAAAQQQLTALSDSIGQMRQNLQGALGQKAVALQQLIASYTANLDQLDATQRQNLVTQIQTQQQDLTDSITAQQTALQQEVASLRANNDEQSQARVAAANAQLAQLQAAQAPLNEARMKGAESLVTSINLGLQSTQDQLRAEAARDGFTGGSTMQDAALARAAIGARQDAAQQIAGARVTNAGDDRTILSNDANQRYSIADALATQNKSASDLGATGTAQLSAALAQGRQGLGDAQATGLRAIGDTTAGSRNNILNQGAQQGYTDTTTGINTDLGLTNNLAQGNYNIRSTLAQQNQDAYNQSAAAQANYYDQLYPNALSAAQIKAGLGASEATTGASIIPYGTAGTKDALGVLNWWATNTQAPGTTATLTQPDTSGNSIAQLGAGLVGSAFQAGAANNWWKKPATTTTPSVTNAGYDVGIVCWVARACYGEDNPRWLDFRDWVLNRAPGYFRAFYLRFGAQIAPRLSPSSRHEIRGLMEAILA